MHNIERTAYGFRITNSGKFSSHEAEEFRHELLRTLSEHQKPFSLLIDIRELIPLSPDVADMMRSVQEACHQMSLERAAIIISSPVLREQAVQVSFNSKTKRHDRFIDASKYPDWEQQAIAWLVEGKEPCGTTMLASR
jgi:hypothetical protein